MRQPLDSTVGLLHRARGMYASSVKKPKLNQFMDAPLVSAPQFNDESPLRAVRSRYFSLWKLMASLCLPATKLVANISNGKYIHNTMG